MKKEQTRREFLKKSIGATALLGFPTIIPSSVLGQNGNVAPSNRVTISVVGCGSRSQSCWAYKNNPKSEIVAVCDPFIDRQIERAAEWDVADTYTDFREVLAREDIDGVHVVTPDHWHVPISLATARAGKDVYCEKPLGVSIEQDLVAREIVERYGRVFQYGTQQRSSDACRLGLELVLNGHIGEVQEVFVWAPGGGWGGDGTAQPVPEGFDYDLWLGPAPEAPYSPDRVSYKGAWFIYDYAIGFIAGWGAHPLDILQWWADREGLGIPVEYKTTGRIPTDGLYDTAINWHMDARYPNGTKLTFIDTRWARKEDAKIPEGMKGAVAEIGNGTFFVGKNGWVSISRGAFRASSEELRRKAKDPGPVRLPISRNHMGNFVDCIISREEPISGLETGIKSDIISQLGDIGIRTGETVGWDPVKETVVGSSDAMAMMQRKMRPPWTL
ncbi:MAG: Gfo/Idh/MocA family oxidoreductase [Verrucomicrobiota bacterium]